MAQETLLHSGEFTDYDGNIIKVSFYQRIDINAYPESLWIDAAGGRLQLEIWSKVGDAELGDPQVDWWDYSQVKAEKIIGTRWYKYYYDIIVDENPGMKRETDIHIFLGDGPYSGQAHLYVHLTQNGQS